MAAPGPEDVSSTCLTFVLQVIIVPEKQMWAAETLEQLIVLLEDPGPIDRVVPGITSAVTKAVTEHKAPSALAGPGEGLQGRPSDCARD